MKQITLEQVKTITEYLLASTIPSRDAQQLTSLLKGLPDLKDAQPESDGK